jgi:beta-lactamase regulating signal transducer with metallopeptidase domain
MSELQAWRLLLFAGEIVLAATLILAVAAMAARIMRTAARAHLVWLCAFAALLLLPLLALLLPPRAVLPAPDAAVAMTAVPQAAVPVAVAVAPVGAALPVGNPGVSAALAALVVLWLPGLLWVALRGLAALFQLGALRRRARRWTPDIALPGLDGCALLLADGTQGPVTWGVLRPVILLPAEADGWPRARLEAVLLHELAHVRRGDAPLLLAVRGVCALYWFHPLVWMAAAALRHAAERAADDAVLAGGLRPSFYADTLLALAADVRAPFALALPMAARPALEARLRAVLDQTQSRKGACKMDVLKIAGIGLSATALLALARPSFAEVAAEPVMPMATPVVATLAAPLVSAPAVVPAPASLPVERALVVAEVTPPADRHSEAKQEASSESTSESERTITQDGVEKTVRESVRRALKRVGDEAQVSAQVKVQVDKALAEAEVSRKVALAAADVEIQKAVADAKAQVRAELARQNETWSGED